jgi:hypothetical protein
MKDSLAKLFGDALLVRLMRFFLFHPDGTFPTKALAEKVHAPVSTLSSPLSWLRSAGFVKKKARGWSVDPVFPHLPALRELLLGNLLADVSVSERLAKAGALKLVVASGIFVASDEEVRTDLLVVGDRMNEKTVARAVALIEADCGTDIRYVLLSTKEFKYRMDMKDRLTRDVFDFPHRKLVNKVGV